MSSMSGTILALLVALPLPVEQGAARDAKVPGAKPACCATEGRPEGPDSEAGLRTAPSGPFITPWLEPRDRPLLESFDAAGVNQDGESIRLDALIDRPTVIAFVYTRCTNPNKCPMTARLMAELSRNLREEHLDAKVRQLIVTYDPEYDAPDKLRDFAARHGIVSDRNFMLLRIAREDLDRLLGELQVAVTYNSFGVNLHRMECVLVDARGRFVRNYHSVAWRSEEVSKDIRALIRETADQPAIGH